MTALSIAFVVSVAMLCGTRLIGRWMEGREAAGRTASKEVTDIWRVVGDLDRRLVAGCDAHVTLVRRVENMDAEKARNEVWK